MKCSTYMNFPDNERLSLWNKINLEAKFCFFIFIRMLIYTCICASWLPKQNYSTLLNIVDDLRRVMENYSTITHRELVLDREAWRAVIHGVAKTRTWLSDWSDLIWSEHFWYSVSWSLVHIGTTWELVKNIYSRDSFQKSLFRSVESASVASFSPDSGPSSQENHTWRSLAFESIIEKMIIVLTTMYPIVSTSFHELFNS